jgi:hypothetical protein
MTAMDPKVEEAKDEYQKAQGELVAAAMQAFMAYQRFTQAGRALDDAKYPIMPLGGIAAPQGTVCSFCMGTGIAPQTP